MRWLRQRRMTVKIFNIDKTYISQLMLKNIKINNFLDDFSIQAKNPAESETILRHRDSNQFILMKEISTEQSEYLETLKTLQYQKKLYHEQLISLIDFYPQQKLFKFIVFYQFCSITLAEEFQSRIQEKRWFEESELWSILSSLVFALSYLQEKNVGHGSVSLFDCYLNEKGFIKICDPTIATSNPFLIVPGYYYSPEILKCVSGETTEDIDVFRSDVFALGCCMLQLSLMMDLTNLFNYEEGIIDQYSIFSLLNEIDQVYSSEYVNFLRHMLVFNSHDRLDLLGLKVKIYELLSLDPEQQSSKLRQSCQIKSSISSLKKSKEALIIQSLNESFSKQNPIKKSYCFEGGIPQTVEENIQSSRKFIKQSKKKNSSRNSVHESLNILSESHKHNKKLERSKKQININVFSPQKSDRKENLENNVFYPDSHQNVSVFGEENKKMWKSPTQFIKIVQSSPQSQSPQGLNFKKRQSIFLEKENVYTDPGFLKMMQTQVQNIIKKRQTRKLI